MNKTWGAELTVSVLLLLVCMFARIPTGILNESSTLRLDVFKTKTQKIPIFR